MQGKEQGNIKAGFFDNLAVRYMNDLSGLKP
jgi:hypothetical protein